MFANPDPTESRSRPFYTLTIDDNKFSVKATESHQYMCYHPRRQVLYRTHPVIFTSTSWAERRPGRLDPDSTA